MRGCPQISVRMQVLSLNTRALSRKHQGAKEPRSIKMRLLWTLHCS
uniref:Uncharacterized protein n=1 Tax=Anguilla anguilla TaxID=7936 RepID=A0A0E9QVL4_ANGAN